MGALVEMTKLKSGREYQVPVSDLAGRQLLAVLEHYSTRPLEELKAYNLCAGKTEDPVLQGRFARYFSGEPDQINLPDESVDCIICHDSYQFFTDLDVVHDKLYRLLRPDGFCYYGGYSLSIPWSISKDSPATSYRSRRLLRKMLSDFWVHDYAGLIREHPAAFMRIGQSNRLPLSNAAFLTRMAGLLSRQFTWVLTRKN